LQAYIPFFISLGSLPPTQHFSKSIHPIRNHVSIQRRQLRCRRSLLVPIPLRHTSVADSRPKPFLLTPNPFQSNPWCAAVRVSRSRIQSHQRWSVSDSDSSCKLRARGHRHGHHHTVVLPASSYHYFFLVTSPSVSDYHRD
jgi:hypothetical protein